ncbi:kinase-like domain-containing protein [Rhizophagus clarus]|uniref:Kinase-like domain-containing protein n=1 Tax=Rhizophagus clarus TaxID=94130 RepID=A0A8H3LBA6_9GLOM|nr:kinase-like domain-containing protein [Rhizophagus clarus]
MSFQQDIADYLEYSKYLKNKFTDWTSGCERIDTLIQKRQLKIEGHSDVIFEWIPFGQFDKIKETSKNGSITVYSAIWKNGPLTYDWDYEGYTRDSNKEVALKLMKNSQNPIEFVINEAKNYSLRNDRFLVLHGLSQNPDTNDYILVRNDSINLTNCISGNEKIDDFIIERQSKIKVYIYSAIWRDGPLTNDHRDEEYTRNSNKQVTLKLIHNSQNSIEFVINKAKKYLPRNDQFLVLYGISQNPDTDDYILVQNNSINLANCTSGNEKIDDFILERQSKIKVYIYSATWKDGPLYSKNQMGNYDLLVDNWRDEEFIRDSNKIVALKLMHNSRNSIEFIINETKKYSSRNGQFQEFGIFSDMGKWSIIQKVSVE